MIFNPVRGGGGKPKQVEVDCRFGYLLAGMQNGVGIGVWENSPGGYIIGLPDHARCQLNMHCFRKWSGALWICWNDEEVWAFWFKQQQVRHLRGGRRLTPKGVTA